MFEGDDSDFTAALLWQHLGLLCFLSWAFSTLGNMHLWFILILEDFTLGGG